MVAPQTIPYCTFWHGTGNVLRHGAWMRIVHAIDFGDGRVALPAHDHHAACPDCFVRAGDYAEWGVNPRWRIDLDQMQWVLRPRRKAVS